MTTRSKTVRTIGFTLALITSVISMSTASHAYTAEEGADVHRRRLQVLLVGDPEYRQGHRLHAEEQGPAQRRLQVGDGEVILNRLEHDPKSVFDRIMLN